MLELKQPYYDHLVIQSKKLLIFFNKKGKLGEQVVEKRVLRRQTKKRTTVCSKINRESEVQTEQFNKEDCQESSAENIEVSSITVEIHDQGRMEGIQAKENTFVAIERKAK